MIFLIHFFSFKQSGTLKVKVVKSEANSSSCSSLSSECSPSSDDATPTCSR